MNSECFKQFSTGQIRILLIERYSDKVKNRLKGLVASWELSSCHGKLLNISVTHVSAS